jgi:hypothetical protein
MVNGEREIVNVSDQWSVVSGGFAHKVGFLLTGKKICVYR